MNTRDYINDLLKIALNYVGDNETISKDKYQSIILTIQQK